MTSVRPKISNELGKAIGKMFCWKQLEEELNKFGPVRFNFHRCIGRRFIYVGGEEFTIDIDDNNIIISVR